MALFKKRPDRPDPVLSAIDELMAFSAQSLEVSREEARVSAERLAALEDLVAKYGAALEKEKAANRDTAERLVLIEQRLVNMGNELAHQLHELGNEIEQLSAGSGEGADAGTLAALKESQIRLAQEQARYQIAFRQDLAALADQLQKRAR